MDSFARLDASDRAAVFGESGALRGVASIIIEKDFWVCWTLKRLFELQKGDAPTLVFKGGTSLSKAYGAIRRFSEDIDLSFDRADLGYDGDRDPEREGISKKQSAKLIDALMAEVEKHIANNMLPALREAIAAQLAEPVKGNWSLEVDANEPQTLNFHYPAALTGQAYQGVTYITPRVKLEFGARGDPWPTEQKTIRPYSADDFPAFFENPDCTVTVLAARRTFWEKVTALHSEAHRPDDSPTPQYFSRHYYDVAMLLDTAEGQEAAADFDMLPQVARHKAVYFRSSWASYDTARPGTLRLMPAQHRLKDLRADYSAMQAMMFDETSYSFDEILARIEKLQATLNTDVPAADVPK
ncbi:nucleotidyl transferase AbiEii/AbiGii toxin family protein [Aminobacter sp. MSH1]|uniref:nucleotidyl transferase AbiEii/AbiGii toxin family protein n=1 Tax=Aminobacter sp. MSH1 TaxID=374606 RepID=UPI000D36218B|nr:nucleotidyl transferase AbiEii/AbiGii toxin family protein [Aminobacter sp. MSH1]